MPENAIYSFALSVFKNGWTTIYSETKNVYGAILSPDRKPITNTETRQAFR